MCRTDRRSCVLLQFAAVYFAESRPVKISILQLKLYLLYQKSMYEGILSNFLK